MEYLTVKGNVNLPHMTNASQGSTEASNICGNIQEILST